MFRKEIKLEDGTIKTVVANSEQALAEGIATVKADFPATSKKTVKKTTGAPKRDSKGHFVRAS